MNERVDRDIIDNLFWRESHANGESKAIASAWVEFTHAPAGLVVVQVNSKPALRVSIKYRDTGPYLAVEVAPGSNESMGSCIRTAEMVKHYEKVLEAHNQLGEIIHSARRFIVTDEERALTKTVAI